MNPLFLFPIKPDVLEINKGLCLKTLKIADILVNRNYCFEIWQHYFSCGATCDATFFEKITVKIKKAEM